MNQKTYQTDWETKAVGPKNDVPCRQHWHSDDDPEAAEQHQQIHQRSPQSEPSMNSLSTNKANWRCTSRSPMPLLFTDKNRDSWKDLNARMFIASCILTQFDNYLIYTMCVNNGLESCTGSNFSPHPQPFPILLYPSPTIPGQFLKQQWVNNWPV